MTTSARAGSTSEVRIVAYEDGQMRPRFDVLAAEEPLEIRLANASGTHSVAVTMRTPGGDFELACGFLFSEGIIGGRADVRTVSYCQDRDLASEQQLNIVTVTTANADFDAARFERHFTISSACGVCGKANLEALHLRGMKRLDAEKQVPAQTIVSLPEKLRGAQGLFSETGGLHAAALFDLTGTLMVAREDVGRHNAVDKILGWALLNDRLLLDDTILMVSGRASYEIIAKALAARIPIVCAVSAPSSLAAALANEFNITLVGFLRGTRFNVYGAPERLRAEQ